MPGETKVGMEIIYTSFWEQPVHSACLYAKITKSPHNVNLCSKNKRRKNAYINTLFKYWQFLKSE